MTDVRIDALGIAIARKRDEAVSYRKETGIEEIWEKCEEAYLGIDDLNRHEFSSAKWAKSTSTSGPVSKYPGQVEDNRSTAFVRLTSRYVDFAVAKVCETALPIDDKPFSIEPTPVPELSGLLEKNPKPQQPQQPQQPNVPAQQQPSTPDPRDIAKAILDQAGESAEKAERRIWDWLVECGHTAELRKVIADAGRIGVGVLKGPVPDSRTYQAVKRNGDVIELVAEKKIAPVTKWIDPWDLFPAAGCGENIHDGDYVLERDHISARKLRKLKGRKGWDSERIERVIAEGPGKCLVNADDEAREKAIYNFEMWQYYGTLSRDELESVGICLREDIKEAYAIVTLINDSVIRCVLNPLDSGRFPYLTFPWSRRAGHWAGVGVAEQCFMPQRMVNAGTRALLNNAGKSAGVQTIVDQGSVTPADNRWEIVPDKLWLKTADTMIDDVRKAFFMFEYPNIQAQLMPVIEYALRLAEEHTSIPLVTQGIYAQGAAPQTYGQAELQNNNANTLLRDKARILDDCVTEPLINAMYEWLMLDPDVPSDEKGDYKINAHGTTALVERAIAEATLAQAIGMSLNPAFGADPKKVYAMWLKAKRIDPREVLYDPEDLAKLQQNPPPQLMIAQIKEQGAMQRAQMAEQGAMQRAQIAAQVSVQKSKMDTDRDRVYVQAQNQRAVVEANARREELQLKREIAYLELQIRRGINVDTNKTKLADTAMRLRTQKELAVASIMAARQVTTPAIEPPGRAPNGEAFQL